MDNFVLATLTLTLDNLLTFLTSMSETKHAYRAGLDYISTDARVASSNQEELSGRGVAWWIDSEEAWVRILDGTK